MDDLVERANRIARNLVGIAQASQRADGTDIPLGQQVREAAALIRALETRATTAEAREAALMKNVQWAQDCMMDYVVEIAKLREALAEELAWHEGEAKALSKQPPRPELEWLKHQHRERIETITAALETDNG
jgi:hypothetical protein